MDVRAPQHLVLIKNLILPASGQWKRQQSYCARAVIVEDRYNPAAGFFENLTAYRKDKQMEMEEYKDEIKFVMEDMFRFGAAIGSWFDSKQLWHNQMANKCLQASLDSAAQEVISRIRQSKYLAAKKYLQVL